MRHKLILLAAPRGWPSPVVARVPRQRDSQVLPSVDRNSTETTVIAAYLDTCLKVARGTPGRTGRDPGEHAQRLHRRTHA